MAHVLHVFKDVSPPTPGGVEQHVEDVTHSLGGHRFTVLTAARSRHRTVADDRGVRIVRAPEYGRVWSTPLTPSWRAELRDTPADLLHVHLPNPLAELAYLAAPAPPPMVASYHADVLRYPTLARLHDPVQQRFLARAARVLVGSPALARSPALAAHSDRVAVVPYGVDPAEWTASESAVAAIRRRHPGPIVLFLGRLVWYKGVDVLLRSMATVDGTLLVVGDGPERGRLSRLAATIGLRRVSFVGAVAGHQRAAHYRAADVFVVPSVSPAESFAIALLEAMACGTPVVSTDLGTGTSWVNVHGDTGMVVPPRDPAALTQALVHLLGDPGLRRELGAAARRRVEAHFSKSAMLDKLGAIYASVLGRSPATIAARSG
jgi:glycosyltransferase involved in cell wall biosynthesis